MLDDIESKTCYDFSVFSCILPPGSVPHSFVSQKQCCMNCFWECEIIFWQFLFVKDFEHWDMLDPNSLHILWWLLALVPKNKLCHGKVNMKFATQMFSWINLPSRLVGLNNAFRHYIVHLCMSYLVELYY